MELIEKMTVKAKANPQRIVLPEGTEPRTLTAADRIIAEKLAEIVLIGDPADIMAMAKGLKLENIKDATDDMAQALLVAAKEEFESYWSRVLCNVMRPLNAIRFSPDAEE